MVNNPLPEEMSALDNEPQIIVDAEASPDLASWEEVEWAMRRIARATYDNDLAQRRYEAQRMKLDDWLAREMAGPDATIRFLQARVERWAVAQRERTGKATFRFPAGDIKTMEHKEPRVLVADEKVLLAYLHDTLSENELPTVVSTTEHVRVSDLRNYLTIDGPVVVNPETGEPVPGVHVEPPSVTSTVKLTDPQEDF